jgi:hypothetical protein
MTLFRCHKLNAAVAMHGVIPGHELMHPLAGLLQTGKRLCGIGRCIFERSEQRKLTLKRHKPKPEISAIIIFDGGNHEAI